MQSAKILVVDDETYLTAIVTMKLQAAGHVTFTAADGEEGFASALANSPDLIITDFQMPVLSGLEMAIRLRENPQTAQTPIILLTARSHRVDEPLMSKTNVRQVVPKPFSSRELMDKVQEVLGSIPKASAA